MPKQKLTLTASREVVSLAEELALREKTSISAMFADFILARSRLNNERHPPQDIGPLTRSLTGIVRLPDDFDENEFMSDGFAEKHGPAR